MAEDYEDWFMNNESELRLEFMEMRGLEAEFQNWAYINHCSDAMDAAQSRKEDY